MPQTIPAEHIDNFYWEAIYNDGSSLPEIEDDGTLHGYREIDQERLIGFILRPLQPHLPQFAVQLGNGRRLVFYRIRKIHANLTSEMDLVNQRRGPNYQVIGFQRTINDTNFKSLTYIDEQGSSFVTDEDNPV